jgi:hypothetical protein
LVSCIVNEEGSDGAFFVSSSLSPFTACRLPLFSSLLMIHSIKLFVNELSESLMTFATVIMILNFV